MQARKWFVMSGTVALAVLIMLGLAIGLTQAQGPAEEAQVQNEGSIEAVASGAIGIQGRLTDPSGNPVPDGTYAVVFSIYDSETATTALCSDSNNVVVQNGLFNSWIDYCYDGVVYGQKLWLGVRVEGDAEMTPRQVIYAVPYALTLRPGALISGTQSPILRVRSTGTGDADAVILNSGDEGEALTANSPNGVAVVANSATYVGLLAFSRELADHPAVLGCSVAQVTDCDSYKEAGAAGVMGHSALGPGVAGYSGQSNGVFGRAEHTLGMGVWAENTADGSAIYGDSGSSDPATHNVPTLYLVQRHADGDFVVGANALWGTRYWRVDRTGKGFFNGGTQTGGADFAEQIAVEGREADYEPGDVLVISARTNRTVELSSAPFDTAVIGVYSTDPGVLAGAPDTDDPLGGIPVAITGIVPCKVSAENGPIHRGDLLVTAATPGHAMRAGENPPQGTIVGKALGELQEGSGVIYILVTLQ